MGKLTEEERAGHVLVRFNDQMHGEPIGEQDSAILKRLVADEIRAAQRSLLRPGQPSACSICGSLRCDGDC